MIHPLKLLSVGMTIAMHNCALGDSAPWTDITSESGLGQQSVNWIKFSDLNTDGYPDIILLPRSKDSIRPVVYLHRGIDAGKDTPVYEEFTDNGLPPMIAGDVLVFSDIDNDGNQDAILGRYLDIYQDEYAPPADAPHRSAWLKGKGDGTFADPIAFQAARLATTRAIAAGDVNEDGLPDIFFGNWYERYFSGYEAFGNDLLLQVETPDETPDFVRWPIPGETGFANHENDGGGRPTYGVALPRLDDGLPMLLELNYGRRWNRLYQMRQRPPLYIPEGFELPTDIKLMDERARGDHLIRSLQGMNIARETHVDGDRIRHGRHPKWPSSQASEQPRSLRPDEKPFRSNGNTFDVAVGDIDNDGDFDLFLSTIIHAWAGESSDRSRFLVNQLQETGSLDFYTFERLSVDRIPAAPTPGQPLPPELINYNQGDIFAELADLNNDGWLDLILCSSDYPDPPPHDERLRIFFQQKDGRFLNVTHALGIDHVGAGMPSLADIDNDGDLDLLVGQSFNRLKAEQRRAAAIASGALPPDAPEGMSPKTRARLFRNNLPEGSHSLMLNLTGNPDQGTTRDAYGTLVRVTADLDNDPETPPVTQVRQVLGPGGHAGKQHMLAVHFGLGATTKASLVEVLWSGSEPLNLTDVPAGTYSLDQSNAVLTPLSP